MKNQNSLFSYKSTDIRNPALTCLEWLQSTIFDDYILATAYKDCAEKIIHDLLTTKHSTHFPHADIYFMPIAYLHRHSLELQMKVIIRYALALDLLAENQNIRSCLNKHNLIKIWQEVKKIISKIWPEQDPQNLDSIEKIICEFHQLDPSGQELRYAKSTKGTLTFFNLPHSLDLNDYCNIFNNAFGLLEGCSMELSVALDKRLNKNST